MLVLINIIIIFLDDIFFFILVIVIVLLVIGKIFFVVCEVLFGSFFFFNIIYNDFSFKFLFFGLVDVYVYFNELGCIEWEGFNMGIKVVVFGGVIIVIDMLFNVILFIIILVGF